jgi:hypothetical protein
VHCSPETGSLSKEEQMSEILMCAELLGHLVAGVYCSVSFFCRFSITALAYCLFRTFPLCVVLQLTVMRVSRSIALHGLDSDWTIARSFEG